MISAVLFSIITPKFEPYSVAVYLGLWAFTAAYFAIDPRWLKWAILNASISLLVNFKNELKGHGGTWDHARVCFEVLASCLVGGFFGVATSCLVWPDTAHDDVYAHLRCVILMDPSDVRIAASLFLERPVVRLNYSSFTPPPSLFTEKLLGL